jgi:alkylation response protein AidB-like acyl-CoA dehydrogenase
MELVVDERCDIFRRQFAAFLDEHAPPHGADWLFGTVAGIPDWARAWQAALFDHGYLAPGNSPGLGGRSASALETLVHLDELSRRGLPRSLHFPGWGIVAPTLLEFGTEAQRALARPALRGDDIWCVGMSEPGAGSDLAGLSTRAARRGDRFVVTGQKVWTSYAVWAEKCLLYVRTDPDSRRTRGLSVLILDLDAPGVDVRPIRHLGGEPELAEVFLDGVEVPAANLVGELDRGWAVAAASLGYERQGLWIEWLAALQHVFDRLVESVRERPNAADAHVVSRLAIAAERVTATRALALREFARMREGMPPARSFLKLATSELAQDLFELGAELGGEDAVFPVGIPNGTPAGRRARQPAEWFAGLLKSMADTIGGGTSEIQREIIASAVLRLPSPR